MIVINILLILIVPLILKCLDEPLPQFMNFYATESLKSITRHKRRTIYIFLYIKNTCTRRSCIKKKTCDSGRWTLAGQPDISIILPLTFFTFFSFTNSNRSSSMTGPQNSQLLCGVFLVHFETYLCLCPQTNVEKGFRNHEIGSSVQMSDQHSFYKHLYCGKNKYAKF